MKDKKYNPFSRILNNQKGVSAILVVILLPVLIGFAALAIDVGYMYTTKNELQNIADGAALAGAGELGRIYVNDVDPTDHASHDLTSAEVLRIQTAVEDVADLNKHDDENEFKINTDDISIGVWNWNSKQLDPADPDNNESADAVQVIARRDDDVNGRVATFFARIFSIFGGDHDKFASSAVATAAISGPSILGEGVANAPFAISQNTDCGDAVTFSPTPSSCAGWHNYLDSNPAQSENYSTILEKMYGFIENHEDGPTWLNSFAGSGVSATNITPPEISLGDNLNLTGAEGANFFRGFFYSEWNTIASPNTDTIVQQGSPHTYAPFFALYDFFRFRDGDDDGTGDPLIVVDDVPYYPDDVWSTVVPMYEDTTIVGCSNPSGGMEIVGYAYAHIIGVGEPPDEDRQIKLVMSCDEVVKTGRSGGGIIGTVKGSIPNLVE